MRSGRFFVTNVLILATAAFLACTSKNDKRSAQVGEGNQQIKTAVSAQSELDAKFKISLAANSAKVDWNKLSKSDRQAVKEKLAEYVSSVTRAFEIDAKKGLYLTQKEILRRQLESAMGLQKALENFESVYGENFEPKNPKDHV